MYTKEYADELRVGLCSCAKSWAECLNTKYCSNDAAVLHDHVNVVTKDNKRNDK